MSDGQNAGVSRAPRDFARDAGADRMTDTERLAALLDRLEESLREPCDHNDRMTARATLVELHRAFALRVVSAPAVKYLPSTEYPGYKVVSAPQEASDMTLRRLLWLRHGCDGLYGDDGEMQCAQCMIDFLRNTPREIEERWHRLGIEKLAAEQRVSRSEEAPQ